LASLGVEITLVTFEKPDDLLRRGEMARIRASLEAYGVRWIPLRYHKHPKVPATAFDLFQGYARGIVARLRFRPDVIHARTFVGGLIGLALSPLLRTKLVYHNEGFYPDEQVDGGVWKKGSVPHRVAKYLEQVLYTRADGIIAMSHRGKDVIQRLAGVQYRETPVIVVPSCVNLEHFRCDLSRPPVRQDVLRFVYIGSIGARYMLNEIGRFVAVACRETRRVHLRVLTLADAHLVNATLRASGLPHGSWSVDTVPHAAMPEELARQHVGLFFLTRGLSEHGCSPTKIGEYWACGLPVVSTANVSDTDDIVRRERVGIIVNDHTEAAYRRAVLELKSLLRESELSQRCRRAAEMHYALGSACDRQLVLYHRMTRTATVDTPAYRSACDKLNSLALHRDTPKDDTRASHAGNDA
jgi:glycosyltransferase involved in cell wall biosynthesis